jgi:hypothetical protein
MTDTATVFWYPPIDNPIPGSKVIQGKERMFESVENAVVFVMETLPEQHRQTALIKTDHRSIHQPDIEGIYAGIKTRE